MAARSISPRPRKSQTYHGQTHTKEYETWHQMLARCLNPRHHAFKDYGGRGITVCQEWRDDFAAFFAHVGPRPPATSLDRYPDNDGNYAPGNVRWATQSEQTRNTRRNHRITFNGETRCLAEWGERTGIKYQTIYSRLSHGWPVELALSEPTRQLGSQPASLPRSNGVLITIGDETLSVAAWAAKRGVKPSLIHDRLYRGWEPERAVLAPFARTKWDALREMR